jgi:hypothetical protein
MDYDEIDEQDFITEINNSDEYGRIFKIMVAGRRLYLRVRRINTDEAPVSVAYDLLHPPRGLSWNNEADRVAIMRVKVSDIRHLLRGIGRFNPNEEEEEEAESLIISFSNYLTNTEGGGLRKRKRKSIKTKSRKSRKTKKSRK